MNGDILAALIRAGLFFFQLQNEDVPDHVKAKAEAVWKALSTGLPAPPNGVEWTEADLQAKDAELTAALDALEDRHRA